MVKDRKARSQSRPGQRSAAGLAVVFILLKEKLEVSWPGRGTHNQRGLAVAAEAVLWHPKLRGDFEKALARLGKPLALAATPVETPDKRGTEYSLPDLGEVLQEFASSKGKLSEDGLVCGSAWLVEAPDDKDARAWLERLPERYINALMRARKVDVPLFPEGSSLATKEVAGRRLRHERRIDFERFSTASAVMLEAELEELHNPVLARFQRFLDQLAGQAAGSVKDNEKMVEKVNELAFKFGVQLFAQDDTGDWLAVKVRCATGPSRTLTGNIEAYTPGRNPRTLHSSSVWPALRAGRRTSEEIAAVPNRKS